MPRPEFVRRRNYYPTVIAYIIERTANLIILFTFLNLFSLKKHAKVPITTLKPTTISMEY